MKRKKGVLFKHADKNVDISDKIINFSKKEWILNLYLSNSNNSDVILFYKILSNMDTRIILFFLNVYVPYITIKI